MDETFIVRKDGLGQQTVSSECAQQTLESFDDRTPRKICVTNDLFFKTFLETVHRGNIPSPEFANLGKLVFHYIDEICAVCNTNTQCLIRSHLCSLWHHPVTILRKLGDDGDYSWIPHSLLVELKRNLKSASRRKLQSRGEKLVAQILAKELKHAAAPYTDLSPHFIHFIFFAV